jgi:hypothetical protein
MVPLQEPDGWHLKMQIAFQNKSSWYRQFQITFLGLVRVEIERMKDNTFI